MRGSRNTLHLAILDNMRHSPIKLTGHPSAVLPTRLHKLRRDVIRLFVVTWTAFVQLRLGRCFLSVRFDRETNFSRSPGHLLHQARRQMASRKNERLQQLPSATGEPGKLLRSAYVTRSRYTGSRENLIPLR